jgi:hypothetical protein
MIETAPGLDTERDVADSFDLAAGVSCEGGNPGCRRTLWLVAHVVRAHGMTTCPGRNRGARSQPENADADIPSAMSEYCTSE